jgi:uncharacterized protein YcfJ
MYMKKVIVMLLSALMLTSCYTTRMGGSPAAVSAGASIGGVLGSIVGDRADGYGGSQFGALLGTVAGAAIGNAVTTPPKEKVYRETEETNVPSGSYNAVSGLQITNIRFIDDNRNQAIDAGESCKIIFEIVNAGDVAAYNIVPVVEETSGMKHLQISPAAQVAYMNKDDRIRYTAVINAGKRLKSGEVVFRVYTSESNGAVSDIHEFSIPTHKN